MTDKLNIFYKDIPGYEGIYQISNTGIVKSLERTIKDTKNHIYVIKERFLKLSLNKGYYFVRLSKNSKTKLFPVHQLVMLAFIGEKPFEKAEIRHLDSNPLNNNLNNLKYGSKAENMQDAVKVGTLVFSRSKLSPQYIQEIAESKLTIGELAKKYKTNSTTIINIKSKKSFKNFTTNNYYNKRQIKTLSNEELNFIRDKNNSRKYIMEKTGYSLNQIKRIRKGFNTIASF